MDELENKEVTVDNTAETEKETKQGKFYTDEEIAMLEQKAGDKRITQYQKTLERKQQETARFKAMNDDEKREYQLQQRENAIDEREKALAMLENKSAAIEVLIEKGLDTKLVDLILSDDADVMNTNIKLLEKAFKESVKREVEARLASKTPKKALDSVRTYTTKDIAELPMSELYQLMQEQPELFGK